MVSTEPNLKIAFAADTDVGATWMQVGALIKAEGAAAVVVAGDMAYDNSQPAQWWAATDAALGSTFPVFIAKGNHDDATKWPGLVSVANQRIAGWGGVKTPSTLNDATFFSTFKGLAMLAIADSGIGDGPSYAAYIKSQFAADNHLWRICQWHKDQQAMQAGGKPDEVGWEPYEACRAAGAIIETGHEHSYARTKTLTAFASQTVDATCSAPDALCVGPGRTFAQTVGTGGRDSPLRVQTQCTPVWMTPTTNSGSCPYWAVIYTASQNGVAGAQFITFNVDGNPKKATGYFKTITGQVIDTFTITAD
jgi:hypothetical protein